MIGWINSTGINPISPIYPISKNPYRDHRQDQADNPQTKSDEGKSRDSSLENPNGTFSVWA